MQRFSLPHPIVLLAIGIAIAAALTWIIPAGEYHREIDPVTARTVAVAGTYATVDPAPVGPFRAVVAIPDGFVEGAGVIAAVLFVGAAFYLLDRVGSLGRLLGGLVRRFDGKESLALIALVIFFGAMGALENMQEEIIAMVPALLVLSRRLRVDALAVVAASAGAAVVGSAFGPTNPFQAGIALTLAQLSPLDGGGIRLAMWVLGLTIWSLWVLRYVRSNRVETVAAAGDLDDDPASWRDVRNLALLVIPLGLYVFGALRWDWGFNELTGSFLAGAIVLGAVAGLGATGTTTALLDGAAAMLPAAILVGMARSISLVLADGHVIDTILHAMVVPLSTVSPAVSALAMIPAQALIHIPVSSVSGQAALTMPIFIPLADLIGLSRQATVLAYQTGGGLMELLTPTNGALLAVLLAAKVPFQKWFRFALGGWALVSLVGIAGVLVALK